MNLVEMKPAELIKAAEQQARQLSRVKTHQLRNIFGSISKMRNDFKSVLRAPEGERNYENLEMSLTLLKPQMAYAAARQRAIRSDFYPFMIKAIESVEEAHTQDDATFERAMERFFSLMESLIAYHKFHGG